MPTYEYRCPDCGEHLEVVQSFKDEPLTTCPNCGRKNLRKVFGAIGIAFKGSGFYKTDSRAASSGKSGSRSASGSGSADGGSSSSESGSGGSSKSDSGSSKSDSGSSKSDSGSSSGSSGSSSSKAASAS
jgi:putative FmdB family regulatory protein